MKKWWSDARTIIAGNNRRDDLFLSLIDENGHIVCANAHMVKSLHLSNPREVESNFFDMVYHANLESFKKAIEWSYENNSACSMELYLRSGHYHPMKWQVNYLSHAENGKRTYLCLGYKLIEDARLKKFNELSHDNQHLILENLNTGIFFQDREGEVIASNQKTAEIFQTTLERLYELNDIGNMWDNYWKVANENGEKLAFDQTPFMRALRTGKRQEATAVVDLRNGATRSIHFTSAPLMGDSNGKASTVVTSIRDVTRERTMSREIGSSGALFQAFMNTMPGLAWLVDDDGSLVFASDSFLDAYGLDKEAALNQKLDGLLPAPAFKVISDLELRARQTRTLQEADEEIKWADGTNDIFHLHVFPIPEMQWVGGHAINLKGKNATEEELRQVNERLLNLNRVNSNAVWEWDMQTGLVYRNEALLDMIGYPLEETKGLTWWFRRIHPEDRNRISDKVKEATEHNRHSWEDEYRFKCEDGTYKHILDRGYIIYENELPVRMIGSLKDISDLKQLEDKLVEEKLQQQKEISETIIRVQENERTRIGHELHDNVNQILSTVKLYLDMLTPSTKEEKTIKSKTNKYILLAIEEIRKLSKELVVPQLKSRSLVESIQTLVEDIHFSNALKIRFTYDHENELLSPGKKITFLRIVQEQLKNILKHSRAKQVDLFLQTKDGYTELIVKDDGIGFDPKHTHQGIGLSNIHERTRFYDGTVDLQTAPGMGCMLTVRIRSGQ